LARGITVGHNAVAMLMRRAGMFGLPLKRRPSAHSVVSTACDLVDRQF
jgi:putative transposase